MCLKSGEEIPADLVVMGVGAIPQSPLPLTSDSGGGPGTVDCDAYLQAAEGTGRGVQVG